MGNQYRENKNCSQAGKCTCQTTTFTQLHSTSICTDTAMRLREQPDPQVFQIQLLDLPHCCMHPKSSFQIPPQSTDSPLSKEALRSRKLRVKENGKINNFQNKLICFSEINKNWQTLLIACPLSSYSFFIHITLVGGGREEGRSALT